MQKAPKCARRRESAPAAPGRRSAGMTGDPNCARPARFRPPPRAPQYRDSAAPHRRAKKRCRVRRGVPECRATWVVDRGVAHHQRSAPAIGLRVATPVMVPSNRRRSDLIQDVIAPSPDASGCPARVRPASRIARANGRGRAAAHEYCPASQPPPGCGPCRQCSLGMPCAW